MPTYQAPRGMRDLLPEEAAGFDRLFAVLLARAARYGYPRIVTPIAEDREVFLRSAGATSDVADKEMYDVTLHGTAGLALRPEGTAPVVRAFTLGYVNPRQMVAVEVRNALTDASGLLHSTLWWMAWQAGLRIACGASLWLAYLLAGD